MLPNTIVHLLSGGLDSVTLLYDLHAKDQRVHCLLFDYKQQHVKELEFAEYHCKRLGIPFTKKEIPALNGLTDENWVVPNRNAILLSLAVNLALQANAEIVTIGCNADDAEAFPDCRPEFLTAINQTVKAAGYKIEIAAPFLTWPKAKIKRLASDYSLNSTDFWTCYRGKEKPCGECLACKKLALA